MELVCEDCCGEGDDGSMQVIVGDEVLMTPYAFLGAAVHKSAYDEYRELPFCWGNILVWSIRNFLTVFGVMELMEKGESERDLALSRWCVDLVGAYDFSLCATVPVLLVINSIFKEVVKLMRRGERLW